MAFRENNDRFSYYDNDMNSPREANSTATKQSREGSSIVRTDLRRFGPNSAESTMSVEQARDYCRRLALSHYENFSVASCLLPPNLRQHFFNVYAYCRWSDDLADETSSTSEATELLAWWQSSLERCYAGHATHPVFVALQQTISAYHIPIDPFRDLISAFTQDQTVHQYENDPQILDYCTRSANPVGRILLHLGGCSDRENVAWSDSICTGLQIANFCQDIQLDASRGRFYLPADRMHRHGISQQEIETGANIEALKQCLGEWCFYARTYLVGGLPLVTRTPRWLARDVQLFVRGGLAIIDNLARVNFDAWNNQLTVSKSQKVSLLIRSMLAPRSLSAPKWRFAAPTEMESNPQ